LFIGSYFPSAEAAQDDAFGNISWGDEFSKLGLGRSDMSLHVLRKVSPYPSLFAETYI
jgi:hypothetical protein